MNVSRSIGLALFRISGFLPIILVVGTRRGVGASFAGLSAFSLLAYNLSVYFLGGVRAFKKLRRLLRKIAMILQLEEKTDAFMRLDPVDGLL